jgi:hypothetical protein
MPSNMTGLIPEDFDSVQCDPCHRLVNPTSAEGMSLVNNPPVTTYGNAQMVVDPGTSPFAQPARRGPYANSVSPFHPTLYSAFFEQGEFCGTCHDVSNPLLPDPMDPYNVQKQHVIERTYSEWKASAFAPLGHQGDCQSCHMPHVQNDVVCVIGTAPLRTHLPVHRIVGGNAWIPDTIPLQYAVANPAAYAATKQAAIAMLQGAARLHVTTNPLPNGVQARVRVENTTGHKLPTGYPEGRRMWLRVKGFDASNNLVFQSGEYDATTAILVPDAQLEVFEVVPGQMGPGGCAPSFHFVLNDCIAKDNRIPPKGFKNATFAAFQGAPVGATYLDGQFWDETFYTLPSAVDRVEAELLYQTASRDYVEFLMNENTTDPWGMNLWNLWLQTGKSPPVTMETAVSEVPGFVEFGAGTPGAGGFVPRLHGGGDPSLGGSVSLVIADGPSAAAAFFVIGWTLAGIPLPCGTLEPLPVVTLFRPLQGQVAPTVPGGGSVVLEIPIPNDPLLAGLVTYVQALLLDLSVASSCTATNALAVSIP